MYLINPEGFVDIRVVVTNVTNIYEVVIPIEEPIEEFTLFAYDQDSLPIPVEYNETHVIAYPLNTSRNVIIEATADIIEYVSENVSRLIIKPRLPSKVVLPPSCGLLSFNGSADVKALDSRIELTYSEPGTYAIEFICLTTYVTTSTPTGTTSSSAPTVQYITYVALVGMVALVAILVMRFRGRERIEVFIRGISRELDDRDIKILKSVKDKPRSISELSRVTGLSKSIVSRKVKKLEKFMLVKTKFIGNKLIVELTEEGVRVLNEVGKER